MPVVVTFTKSDTVYQSFAVLWAYYVLKGNNNFLGLSLKINNSDDIFYTSSLGLSHTAKDKLYFTNK